MKLSIHGSCVSRDTFEFLPDEVELVRYIARQSFISAGSPAPAIIHPERDLASPFQSRMLAGDLAGDGLDQLREVAPETDLLVCDLTDERLGVYALRDGSFVTRTVEGLANELYPDGLTLLELGTDEHYELFVAGLDRWAAVVEEVGLADRVVVLHVPWASRTVDGDPTPSSFRLSADLANVTYSRYFHAVFDRLDPHVIRPRVPVLAHSDHQWGPAAFHYRPEVHADLAEQLLDLANQLS